MTRRPAPLAVLTLEDRLTPAGTVVAREVVTAAGKTLVLDGDAAANAILIEAAGGGNYTVSGQETDGGRPTRVTQSEFTGITRIVTNMGAGQDVVELRAFSEPIEATLVLRGGEGRDRFALNAPMNLPRLEISGGDGADLVTANPNRSPYRVGAFDLRLGAGMDRALLAPPLTLIATTLNVDAGPGEDVVAVRNVVVGPNTNADTDPALMIVGRGGSDFIELASLTITGRTDIDTGSAGPGIGDRVAIDDCVFTGYFHLAARGGNDRVGIEQDTTMTGISTVFTGNTDNGSARIRLGGGADVLYIGVPGDISGTVEFRGDARISGQSGTDSAFVTDPAIRELLTMFEEV